VDNEEVDDEEVDDKEVDDELSRLSNDEISDVDEDINIGNITVLSSSPY